MRPGGQPRAALRYLAEDAKSGYCEASYRLVEALRAEGVQVEYRAWHGTQPGRPEHVAAHSRDRRPRCSVGDGALTVAHLVPEHYPSVRRAITNGPLVAHTAWETDRLPGHWPELLNTVDTVVVPCEWNRAVFAASGVTSPLAVVPHVACAPAAGDRGHSLGLPEDVLVFYTIARWDTRKAPSLALRAFLEAFTASDPVALVIHTTSTVEGPLPDTWGARTALAGTTGLEVARIIRHYRRPPHVRLEVRKVSSERIAGLHSRGDCYLSLTHGEGWGLGEFDACAYGNPVITTGWGGPLEYLGPDAAWLVESDLAPVHHHQPHSYSPDQRWAEPNIQHAVDCLREIAADPRGARRRAAPLRNRVLAEYAPDVVARRFLAAVTGLL